MDIYRHPDVTPDTPNAPLSDIARSTPDNPQLPQLGLEELGGGNDTPSNPGTLPSIDITAPRDRGAGADVPSQPVTAQDRPKLAEFHISSPDDISAGVLRLGEAVAAEAVVIGSGAAYAALGEDVRRPGDLDVTVSPEAYAYLRSQPGWEEANGRLANGQFDVGLSWASAGYETLKARSWVDERGVSYASLSDVVGYKTWERPHEPKDAADVAAIRNRLLDPTKPPLPDHVIATQIEAARSCLPENLRDHPDAGVAIKLAANGLATVQVLYGDPRIGRPNQIVGDLELPEYQVPATYHNGFDTTDDMRTLARHMSNIRATPEEHFAAQAAEAYSDAAYGNGRRYDELCSARLLAAHATMLGYDAAAVDVRGISVLGTGFDEDTGKQVGRRHPNPVVRGTAGVDLQILSEASLVARTNDLAVEDGHSARFSPARTLGKVTAEQGVRIGSTQEGLEFIDEYAGARPSDAPDGPTVMEWFAGRIDRNADFTDPATGYTPPDGWTLEDRVQRVENANKQRDIARRLREGTLDAQGAGREAEEHRLRFTRE